MPNHLKIDTNEVENGYIYKHLNNRMNVLEASFKEINNLLHNIQIDNTTIDFNDLLRKIENKASKELVERHIYDDRLHVSGIMKTFIESENFVPRKFSQIYQVTSNTLSVNHNLKTKEIVVGILDTDTSKIINREITLVNANSLEINFENIDLNKTFRITVIS